MPPSGVNFAALSRSWPIARPSRSASPYAGAGPRGSCSSRVMRRSANFSDTLAIAQPFVGRGQLGHFLFEVRDDAARLHAKPLARGVRRGRERRPVTLQEAPDLTREDARVDRLLHEPVAPDGRARVAVALGGD